MFGLLKKDVAGGGTVYFRGNIPPRPEEFAPLKEQGYELGRPRRRRRGRTGG